MNLPTHDRPRSSANRTLVILVVVLVLAAARGIQVWLSERTAPVPNNPLATLESAAVTQLRLVRGQDTVTLLKGADSWALVEADDRADGTAVTQLLTALTGAQVLRIAAANPPALEPFGLAADTTLVATITRQEGDPVSLALSTSMARATAFLRVDPNPAVYEVRWDTQDVPVRVDAWRSREILPIDVGTVTEVEVRGQNGFTLRRSGQGFRVIRGTEESDAEASKAQSFLLALQGLRATGFLAPDEAKGLDKPAFTIFIRRENLPELELKIGTKTETGDYPAKTNQRAVVMGITETDLKDITAPDLSPAAPASSTPEASSAPAAVPVELEAPAN